MLLPEPARRQECSGTGRGPSRAHMAKEGLPPAGTAPPSVRDRQLKECQNWFFP